jgi:predicted outer membrane repeat protein
LFGRNFLRIYNSTLSGNVAGSQAGGAIYADQVDDLYLADSLIDQNSANSDGGAIAAYVFGGLHLDRCVIRRNHANGNGGAIWSSSAVSVLNSAFIANSGYDGGAIYGSANLVNVTMHSNQAQSNGGAIAEPVFLNIFNSTIVSNHANTQGGGFFFRGQDYSSHVANSILYGNSASYGADCVGAPLSDGYNLIGTMAGCSLRLVSSDRTNINPLLTPISPPLVIYLTPLSGSPAIDGGNPAGCTNGINLLTFDQNGTYRPYDGNYDGSAVCDVGAIEVPKPSLFLPSISK